MQGFFNRGAQVKRVAIFGNAGGGKSTLAKRLADLTGLPLHAADMLRYRPAGGEVPEEDYLTAHSDLISRDEWIIDGFGSVDTAWERFDRADTLIHVDLALARHALWVTKRLVKGLFVAPEGWPAGSPMWRSSLNSYRVLWPCHRQLTPRYREIMANSIGSKRVHHLRSPAEIKTFLHAVSRDGGG